MILGFSEKIQNFRFFDPDPAQTDPHIGPIYGQYLKSRFQKPYGPRFGSKPTKIVVLDDFRVFRKNPKFSNF